MPESLQNCSAFISRTTASPSLNPSEAAAQTVVEVVEEHEGGKGYQVDDEGLGGVDVDVADGGVGKGVYPGEVSIENLYEEGNGGGEPLQYVGEYDGEGDDGGGE